MTMDRLFEIVHEIIWRDGHAHKYPTDPEEVAQVVREKRRQREIDERIRRQVSPEKKEQPPDPKEPD